jgi:hypothetical protein
MIFLTGCTSTLTTQQLDMGVAQKESFTKVVSEVEKDESSQNEMWYWLNLARMYQVQKEYKKSIEAFNKAEAILDEYENRASISLRNIGAGLGSTFFSKGAETYYAKGYERTLMHTLNSLNYAMLGNFEAATVEMRRMEKRQEFWLKESEAKIMEAKDKKSELRGNPETGLQILDVVEVNGNEVKAVGSNLTLAELLNNYKRFDQKALGIVDPFALPSDATALQEFQIDEEFEDTKEDKPLHTEIDLTTTETVRIANSNTFVKHYLSR